MLKLGILGGTFDPVHLGHLRMPEEIAEDLELESVFLVPSALPPHKSEGTSAAFADRLAMVQLAVAGSIFLKALDLEGKRKGLSYSIDTLREIKELFRPDPELFFIIGMDAFLEIDTWKEYISLFDYAHFVVINRKDHDLDDFETLIKKVDLNIAKTTASNEYILSSGNRLILRHTTRMDISSTLIRHQAGCGKSLRYLVPESVNHYIMDNQLYRRK